MWSLIEWKTFSCAAFSTETFVKTKVCYRE